MIWITIIAAETILASAITAVLYWRDKSIAVSNRSATAEKSRISERTLLTSCLLGGWPGGLWASRRFRHKTQKLSYRIQFWIAAVVHLILAGSILVNF